MRQIVRPKGFAQALGISIAGFYRLVEAGVVKPGFPIVPGGKAVGWTDDYVDEIIAKRVAAAAGEIDDSEDRAKVAALAQRVEANRKTPRKSKAERKAERKASEQEAA